VVRRFAAAVIAGGVALIVGISVYQLYRGGNLWWQARCVPGRHRIGHDELYEDQDIKRTGLLGGAQGVCGEHLAQWEKRNTEGSEPDGDGGGRVGAEKIFGP